MPAPLSPMTPELKALIEKTHRAEAAKGNSTSKRAIAAILREQGYSVSDSRVYEVQKKMSDYNPKKSYKPPPPSRTPQAKISADAYKNAVDNLTRRGINFSGWDTKKILQKSQYLNQYDKDKDLIKVRSALSGYAKSKTSPDKVQRAGELLSRLNADKSLAYNEKFLQQVEAVKNIGVRPREENPRRKSEIRRIMVQQQTPIWALRPAYQVELAATGYDRSRGESDKNVNIKKLFPGRFEIDHIRRLSDGGLNTPENLQVLTKEQHNVKRGLENKGLLQRAMGLFSFNPRVGPAAGLLAENQTEVLSPGAPFQMLMLGYDPLRRKQRWEYD